MNIIYIYGWLPYRNLAALLRQVNVVNSKLGGIFIASF